MTQKCAIIQFPGSNCEYETAKAATRYGFDVDIIRWNVDEAAFHKYDAYILPGGFSFQDRVRAGVVSAKLAVMSYLKNASADEKPILGICNGCQMLAESGLVTDVAGNAEIEIALAPNTREEKPHGFMCDWVYVRPENPDANVFTSRFSESDVIPIPVNHGEGHFVLSQAAESVLPELASFRYCTVDGKIEGTYPTNPNGTAFNIAGLSNQQGNVFAIMPHPERAAELRQIPVSIRGEWSEKKRQAFAEGQDGDGPWANMFLAMSDYVAKKRGVYATR